MYRYDGKRRWLLLTVFRLLIIVGTLLDMIRLFEMLYAYPIIYRENIVSDDERASKLAEQRKDDLDLRSNPETAKRLREKDIARRGANLQLTSSLTLVSLRKRI